MLKHYTSPSEKNESLMGQNYMSIVYHNDNLSEHHLKELKLRIEKLFYYSLFFNDVLNFTTYIKRSFLVKRIVFILTGSNAGCLYGVVTTLKNPLSSPLIYEIQFGKEKLQSNLEDDRKFRCIDRLFEKIDQDLKAIPRNESSVDLNSIEDDEKTQHLTLPIGIFDPTRTQKSFIFLHRDALKFHLFQKFIEALLERQRQGQISLEDIQKMWRICRQLSINDDKYEYLCKIDDFESRYNAEEAIRFYTKNTFLFRYVNKAFRNENTMQVFNFRPLTIHIHEQLCKLRDEQCPETPDPIVLYRGKKLPTSVLQQLQDNIGHLVSMNGFLSTTQCTDVSKRFADNLNKRMGYESVCFEMHLEKSQLDAPTYRKVPHANIAKKSAIPDEDEVLFFMGFVWRIRSVDQKPDNEWKVHLELCTNDDLKVIKNFNEYPYITLGRILHELREYRNAMHFYDQVLDPQLALSPEEYLSTHFQYAQSAYMLDMYNVALEHIRKAEEFLERAGSPNNDELSPMSIATCTAIIHHRNDGIVIAARTFEEARQKSGSLKDKAKLHFFEGELKFERGDYANACKSYDQARSFAEKAGDPELQIKSQQRFDEAKRAADR